MRFNERLWKELKKGSTPLEALPSLGWTTTQADVQRVLAGWKELGLVTWEHSVMSARLTEAGEKRKGIPS